MVSEVKAYSSFGQLFVNKEDAEKHERDEIRKLAKYKEGDEVYMILPSTDDPRRVKLYHTNGTRSMQLYKGRISSVSYNSTFNTPVYAFNSMYELGPIQLCECDVYGSLDEMMEDLSNNCMRI